MKLKVLKPFNDKVTNAKYSAGDEIIVSDTRGKEILSHPLEVAELMKNLKKQKRKGLKKTKKMASGFYRSPFFKKGDNYGFITGS